MVNLLRSLHFIIRQVILNMLSFNFIHHLLLLLVEMAEPHLDMINLLETWKQLDHLRILIGLLLLTMLLDHFPYAYDLNP